MVVINVKNPEAFVEHYGVKGMQWGVRRENQKAANESVKKAKANLTSAKATLKKEKQNRTEARKATAKSLAPVAAGVAVVAGTAAVIAATKKHGSKPVAKVVDGPRFRAVGKDFIVETNNAEAFRITMAELARRAAG